ncbi:hypothetical protein KEJ13_09550, partial [Candidatus Bathyarchaeota archaeon]|nr:hypothetical protein [Candidatus Bathyarchaeota archaeon]
MSLKEEFLELLERDREFRHTVAGIIGYGDILENIKKHDKKFNEIMAELREHTKRFEEHDKKFNEIMAELREHTKRFEEHDKKFNEIMA